MKERTETTVSGIFRLTLVIIAVVLQVSLIIVLVLLLRSRAVYIYFFIQFIALVDIIFLAGRKNNRSFIIAWLIVISILPVFGHILYILWGRCPSHDFRSRKMNESINRGKKFLDKKSGVYAELGEKHPERKRISGYLGRQGFPLYKNTKCEYFPLGELKFAAILKDLENAKKYIFLEYFILRNGKIWDSIEEVLLRKAKEGIEVKLLFDDLGSLSVLSANFLKRLGSQGIQIKRFNPVHRHLSQLHLNHRNHQKITVIDGVIGYTGGTNLGDEYANLFVKYGHWKDTGIRMEGDAVWSLTVSFLQMWDSESRTYSDYETYRAEHSITENGFFQPFIDGPMNNPDNPAEVMYRKLIYNAKEYLYITSPYLVIDNTMMDALCNAAMSGTDIRIITPKIWDQWYVHMVTQANYGELLKAGVRIYEYTPGFMHAKTIISDDDQVITGTINMDYRSFYLHYENGVWICGDPVVKEIKKDLLDTLALCEEIKLEDWIKRPLSVKCLGILMRLFAVLF